MRSLAVKATDKLAIVSAVPTQGRAGAILAIHKSNALSVSITQDSDATRSYMLLRGIAVFWSGNNIMSDLLSELCNADTLVDDVIYVLTNRGKNHRGLTLGVIVIYNTEKKEYMRIFHNGKSWKRSPWYGISEEAEGEVIIVGHLEGDHYVEMVPLIKNLVETKTAYPLEEIVKQITGCDGEYVTRLHIAT